MSNDIKLKALQKADNSVKSNALNDSTNSFVQMASSGARGSKSQVAQINYAPGLLSDHNGDVILHPVLGNYGQGMEFADYWTTLYGARKGSLDKQLMTSKPGALNKEIVNTAMNIVIGSKDCGTKHGIPMNTEDAHLIGRYLTDGTLVTKANIDSIRKHHKEVIIRSPAMCELPQGVCQICYGLDSEHNHSSIGTNIGIQAAQSLSEPLTQSAMKTFHTGGIASASGGVFGGFETVANFLQAPETFKNKAILSKHNGMVESITPGSAGGWHININGENHFVNPRSGNLLVKKGDEVKRGDLLNIGIPHPKDALNTLGVSGGIHKIVDTLSKIYKDSGISMDRRNIETIVRATSGFGIIKDEGTHPNFVKNDIVPLSSIISWNKDSDISHEVNVIDSYGKVLEENVRSHKKGTIITNDILKDIEKYHNKKHVQVKNNPIEYERTYIGVQQAPLFGNNIFGKLGYRYLKRGLQDAAVTGSSSDIHDYHPVPSFIMGSIGDTDANGHY
jgi:hypothetical protein